MAKSTISVEQYLKLSRCHSMAEWNLVADLIGLSDEDKDIALRYWLWPKLAAWPKCTRADEAWRAE